MDGYAEDRSPLRARRLGIDTHQEPVVYMREDCQVCRSEGFEAQSRVRLRSGSREVIATLNVVRDQILGEGEAGLSEAAWNLLGVTDGAELRVSHPRPLESLSQVRAKIYGHRLEADSLLAIVRDVVEGRYADVHLAAFLTACAGDDLDDEEVTSLTRAMVETGERLTWEQSPVMDKHSVGGLPGNRTTPVVVPIVAACGLVMPKTSSRAITSPAGTADTMETITRVDLDLDTMRRVVDREGACMAWGGSVRLSPADDILIRVERVLDLDSEGQLVASVLSKKVAAGSTHVVLDMPVGPTAKVRNQQAAARLAALLEEVGGRLGLTVRVVATDGAEPVGRGIGPALEARDVLSVLRSEPDAPADLRDRSCRLAGEILELGGAEPAGEGFARAEQILASGKAWDKFQAICLAQGGLREPPEASRRHEVSADHDGPVASFDNRILARIAKLAGAPADPAAGVELHVRLGDEVRRGDLLYTIHADSPGELAYAREYAATHPPAIGVAGQP